MERIAPSARLEAQIEELLGDELAANGEKLSELGRLGARLVLQRAVEDEVTAFLGRARYARTPEAAGSRNGTRPKTVISDVSFALEPGQILAFLGHNGAGKTTTIRMLTGRARPTAGSATITGYDVVDQRDDIKPIINAVFEDPNLYERLSGRDNLRLFCALYDATVSRADELLEIVGLTSAAKRKVKTYSSGMKQRLLVARALVNKPRVLFMDEPTRGLDPTSARELRALVKKLAGEGTTIFLTTHYMEEADELCNRLAIIDRGRLLTLGPPAELKRSTGADTVVTVTAGGDLDKLAKVLQADVPGAQQATRVDHTVVVEVRAQTGVLPLVFSAAERNGFDVSDLSITEPTLETVFINLTGKDLRE